ncbi:hypothetical protein ACFXPS_28960 [Nocardia sp. NPDC059091]|uniref:hypothetical protein n=1 Tax=unclassified Nocardia TaxID=2637762 RepID=UPI0036C8B66F
MRPSHPHDNDHTDDDTAGNPSGRVVPLHRPARRDAVTVEHIETEPMTGDQYRRAVTALAALIGNWHHAATDRDAA